MIKQFTHRKRLFGGSPEHSNEQGVILIAVLMIAAVLTVIGLSLATDTTNQYSLASSKLSAVNADMVAEAGIEQSLQQLNQNSSFTGYSTAQVFINDSTQGYGTFKTTVTNTADTNAKVISSVGTIYHYNQKTKAIVSKGIKVTVVGTASPGYSIYSGPGGLNLSGSASINNANVYVNGTISMSGAARIGSDLIPADVHVANDVCPTGATPGATYPTVCTSGAQPISIPDYSTTSIIGTVCATGQTQSKFPNSPNNKNQPQIRAGSVGGEGLKANCTAAPAAMPTYDRAGQISAVTTTGSGSSNTYVCNSWPFDRTWPGNLQLTGNVTIDGSCNLKVKGNVYITGNLNISGAARITVDESVGTVRPVIIVDGTITVGGSAAMISNSKGTGIQFISFKSSAACSPSCTTLTGNNLKTSQSLQTVSVGGGVSFPGMIFDAYWGKITITGSGNIGTAIGQTIDMSGAGTITFGTSLSSGSSTWTISSYQTFVPT